MRLFIAFDIPEKVKEQLVSIQKKIKTEAKIKWVKAENIHLTLKFLGDVAGDKVDEIKARLENISFEPFDVEVSGIGVFPSESYIKVIWVGLRYDRAMENLVNEIREQLNEFKDDYPFKAHITIGRVRFVRNKKALVEELKKIKVKSERFTVRRFKLYKSMLTKEGPVYEELAEFS